MLSIEDRSLMLQNFLCEIMNAYIVIRSSALYYYLVKIKK